MINLLKKKICMILFIMLCIIILNAQNVNPVKNLTGNCNNGKVTLNWGEPDLNLGEGFWLTYASNNLMGYIGTGQEGEVRSAARFTASDLTDKGVTSGDKIALMQIILNGDDCSDLYLHVYDGGMLIPYINIFMAGTLQVEQRVDLATIDNNWTTIPLNAPHTIDLSKELWFGFSVYASDYSSPLAYDWGPGVENKSDLIWTMSTLGVGLWSTLYAASSNEYSLNACIKAYITKNDIPLLSKYYIYQDDEKIAETTSRTYSIEGVDFGQHNFCVVAVYNNNAQSAEVCRTINCNEVCNSPANLAVSYSEECDKATLTWTAPTTDILIKFNVYRDGTLIESSIEETTYVDEDFDKNVEHVWNVETVCQTVVSNQIKITKPACTLNINEPLSNISIYPNPASKTVTVKADNFQKVEIYNTFGQLIEVTSTYTVDVSTYSAGIYFFKVYDVNNALAIRKVTILR